MPNWVLGIVKTWSHILVGVGVLVAAMVVVDAFARWIRSIERDNAAIRRWRGDE